MKIEIQDNMKEELSIKLLTKFLNMASNSDFNYLQNDSIYVGYNNISGFGYVYLENEPSLSICTDIRGDFCIVYTSSLDGFEFIQDLHINSLDYLERIMNKAYEYEYDIREDDYNDTKKTDKFIQAMADNGWDEL